MAPKRQAAAAASGSAFDGEANAANHQHHSASPTPSPSHSRSKTPPSSLHPNLVALSLTPISAAVDLAAASDSDADTDARRPPRRRSRERSPRLHSDSDVDGDGDGRLPSPRRSRGRSPRLHSDSENSAAASDDGDHEDNASPPPRSRRSSRVDAVNIKPISSRPMDVSRRPAAGSSQRRSKRPRSSTALLSSETQKRPPRVWSPEDEITILRALIAYRAKKGVLPASTQDTGKLHSKLNGHLSVKASTTQLSDKVRRLRQKYSLLMTRAKDGQDPDLPTVHDRDLYELSKKVWGSKSGVAGNGGGGGRAHADAEVAESDEEVDSGESDVDMDGGWDEPDRSRNRRLKAIAVPNGNGNAMLIGCRTAGHGNSGRKGGGVEKGKDMYPYLWEAVEELSKEHPSGIAFRKAFGVLEGSRALAMEEKLQKFKLSEIRQQLRRMDLMKETVKMVLDALEGAE